MVRKRWMKGAACLGLTAALLAGQLGTAVPGMLTAQAAEQRSEFFADGDLGDDAGDDLWSGNWNFADGDNTWSVVGDGGIAYSSYAANNTKSGLGIYFSTEGTVSMYQTIADLPAGSYTITGYAKESNIGNTELAVYTGAYDQTLDEKATVNGQFQKFSFTFTVDQDMMNYKVGFQITSAQGAWVCLDSLSLTERASDEEERAEALAELDSAVTACSKLQKSYYRASSWSALQNALAAAETIKEKADAATEEIRDAADAVKTARNQLKQASLHVEKIENLSSDFIKGVDLSSYVSVTDSGAVFKDWDGNVIGDEAFFNLIKEAGVNYVRVRIWNNPYDSDGNGYGGGNSDLEKAKKIGKLASDAGMKVLIDFHYSDFWADPDRQTAPKEWTDLSVSEKADAVYEYTKDSLQELREAGVDVGMVQIGNETNHGIAGVMESSEGGWTDICKIFSAGSRAVREISEDILVAVHFTDPQTPGSYEKISATLDENHVDYDVFASSYYPSMHGSMDNLTNVLKQVADTYDKKVMVAETSWAWTKEDGDGYGNSFDASKNYDYSVSEQGQANILRDVMQAVANVGDAGIGMFYWEPAWIPASYAYQADGSLSSSIYSENLEKWKDCGCGWASEYAKIYDKDHVDQTGGSVIDNQALFDFEGNPLESLNVFKYVNTGCEASYKVLDVVKTISVNAASVEEAKSLMPETVEGTYNDGSTEKFAVTWDEDALNAISGFNVYQIPGTITYQDEYGVAKTMTTSCTLAVLPDSLIENGDFEDGDEHWTVTDNGGAGKLELKWNDTPLRGEGAMHFWSSEALDFSIEQTVTVSQNATYAASMQIQGGSGSDSDHIYIEITNLTTGEKAAQNAALAGYTNWQNPNTDSVKAYTGNKLRVKVVIQAAASAWGSVDDVFLYKTGNLAAPDPKPDEGDDKTDGDGKTDGDSKTDDGIKEESKGDGSKVDESKKDSGETKLPESDIEDTKTADTKTEDTKTAGAEETGSAKTEVKTLASNGIVLKDSSGILSAKTVLTAEKITDSEMTKKVADKVKKLLSGAKEVVLYELNLNDGTTELHQLDGRVEVSLDLPFSVGENEMVKVYRIDNDQLIECPSQIENGKLVFTTDHFSTYAVVRADAALNVQTGVDSGDHNEASGWLLLSMLGLTIVCASLGRKRIAK